MAICGLLSYNFYFEASIEDVDKAISDGLDSRKVDQKFRKVNENFEACKKLVFENFSDKTDEEQSDAFEEMHRIEDKLTKIKIKVYRYKS